MKSMKQACKVSAKKKLSNMRKAFKHGGRIGYALGGEVDDEEDMTEPMSTAHEDLGIDGSRPKKRLDKAKTNINIIIAGGGNKPQDGPMMPPVMPNLPPVPGKPPLPPMPMPPAGGPPPMAKNGGRMGYKNGGSVKHKTSCYKHGGAIKHAAGGGLGRLEKIKAYGLKPAKGK